MIWMVIAVALGLALGVGFVLVLARPASLQSHHKRGARKKSITLEAVASPAPVEASFDSPPEVDRAVDFPQEVVKAAWRRQGGQCANCGRLLIWPNRDRDSGTGAWQSHHRTPRDQGGSNNLKNCVLLCSGMGDCHFNVGHGGIGWDHYAVLEDYRLLYLRHRRDQAPTTAPQKRTIAVLVREAFGIRAPAKPKKHSASKPNARRPGPFLPHQDDSELLDGPQS